MQLTLPQNELNRRSRRVGEDYLHAIADHQARMERFRGYYQRWRNRVDPPHAGEEDLSNFSVPLVQWNVYNKWADDLGKLLGDDAEIIAQPVGPSDQKRVQKIGCFMSWLVFNAMKLTNPFAVFDFRKILFGRAHAYSPWVKDTYPVRDEQGNVKEVTHFEGPGFFPLWPDDIITPAEDVDSIHDFTWVIRRYRVTPDAMLRGEDAGLYQGVSDNYEELVRHSQDLQRRDWLGGENIKREKDLAEGVLYEGGLSARGSLVVHEWMGRWRKIKGSRDAAEDNLKNRDRFESDLVVRCLPDLDNKVVGVQDLMDLYPKMRNRRPLVECSLVKDGSYWSPGLGEILESIEDETTVNHRVFTEGGQLAVGPIIFYKPSAGFNPDTFRYQPGQAVATEDPASVNAVRMQADLQPCIVKEQSLISYAERTTGINDFNLGRGSDRPNAPRTARGTMAILEGGNVRANLDVEVFREDMGVCLQHFWDLEQNFPDADGVFFRVTEEDAKGLFDTHDGGAKLMPDELEGRYDFSLKFATNVWSREADKEKVLSRYQLDLANPLIVNNPRALWMVTNAAHNALGDSNFADIVPEPPDPGTPKQPKQEWTLALEGEDLMVNPADNDGLHLIQHGQQVRYEMQRQEPDKGAVTAMVEHIHQHRAQAAQKQMMQALSQHLVQQMASNMGTGQGLQVGGMPANLQRLQQVIQELSGPPAGSGIGTPGAPNPAQPAM